MNSTYPVSASMKPRSCGFAPAGTDRALYRTSSPSAGGRLACWRRPREPGPWRSRPAARAGDGEQRREQRAEQQSIASAWVAPPAPSVSCRACRGLRWSPAPAAASVGPWRTGCPPQGTTSCSPRAPPTSCTRSPRLPGRHSSSPPTSPRPPRSTRCSPRSRRGSAGSTSWSPTPARARRRRWPHHRRDWDRMLDLNLTAPFRCVRRAMPADGRGRLGADRRDRLGRGQAGRAVHRAYTATKHGVLGLVRSAAAELAARVSRSTRSARPTSTPR